MIDAHHHLWDVSAREYPWLAGEQVWATPEELARLRRSFTLADLLREAAPAGTNGTVVVQTVTEPWETADLLALAAGRDPWGGALPAHGAMITAVVGWADLALPGVAEELAGLRALPGGEALAGVRHPLIEEADPGWLITGPVLRGLRALGAAGLCFDVMAFPSHLRTVVAAAQQVPELTFVLDHLGGPPVTRADDPGADRPWADSGADGSEWATAIGELGALPNVACKLSGAHSSPATATALRPYFETVLAAFGPNRLMFGSDWPVSALIVPYPDMCGLYRQLTAELSQAEQTAIMHTTARRVYHLRPSRFGWAAYAPPDSFDPPDSFGSRP